MHAVPLGARGRSEFVAKLALGARSANLISPRPSGLPFTPEEAGSRFKRLRLRNKLLVRGGVEDHDEQVAEDKDGA
jgi:hypothetical protein